MFTARSINTDHKDLIHDVAYDFYGTRMATCSSDHSVRIWETDSSTGNWNCTAHWKAHSGSVWKVTWANPDFGQVIATCSFDRTAVVWEEVVGESSTSERTSGTHWVKRTTLVDSRTSVTDVKFGPKSLGLTLASCSADGFVRIYEAPDVMNLTQWSLQHEISVKVSCSCLAWNLVYPRHSPAMVAVGSDDPSPDTPKVMLYEFSDHSRRWVKSESLIAVTDPVNDLAFAPNLGRSFHMLGIASKDMKIVALEPEQLDEEPSSTKKYVSRVVAHGSEHNATVWRVAWNVTGTILASSGDDGCIRLWKGSYNGTWSCISTLRGEGGEVTGEMSNGPPLPPSLTAAKGLGGRQQHKPPVTDKAEVAWH